MGAENTITTTAGLHKEVYGGADDVDKVMPNSSVIYDIIGFADDERIGDSFHQALTLTFEHGFTYNGSGGAVASLNASVAANMQDATITSVELIGRSRMAYTAASRAAAAGKQAFKKAWSQILLNLRRASMKRLELMLLYGQQGLGVVESVSTGVITITEASWSPTTWAGMEGCVLEAFTTTAASATQHDTDLTISAINLAAGTRTITVTGTSTSVVANDILFFKGAKTTTTWNDSAGLMKIVSNSGTLFGIDSTTYNLFAGNTSSSFGTPTMGKFLSAVTECVDRGMDEKVYLGVCSKSWEVMNADLAANREFDGSYSKSKAENGSQAISYYGQAGEMEVRSMPFLRRGDAVIFPASPFKRIGSSDIGMGVPGLPDASRQIYFHLEDKNAVEVRSFTDQALFGIAPSHCAKITGITYE